MPLARLTSTHAGKAEVQSRRNEKLARRNPERLQKQLDDLKAIESSGGKLTAHEKTALEGLEKDIKAVRKARDALGDAAPKFGSGGYRNKDRDGSERGGFGGGRGGGVLGKRRRDDAESSEEEDVPEDVKSIPMPRDTPPPVPKEVLDKWYQKRRERMAQNREARGTNANTTPLGRNDRSAPAVQTQTPPAEVKTVYEAKPIVRNLRKEAVSFVPAAVRAKLEKSKGIGGLVEPEEADRLEKEGYMSVRRDSGKGGSGERTSEAQNNMAQSKTATVEEVDDEDG